jgi:hypothetical protein
LSINPIKIVKMCHDLASWSPAASAWEVQAGTYSISVGDSSVNRPLTAAPGTRGQARRRRGGATISFGMIGF